MDGLPCFCTTLRRSALDLTAVCDARLRPSGRTVTMKRLLKRIAARGPSSITALARKLDLDRSTLGRNLRVPERQNPIEIAPGQDEQTRRVTVGDAGRAALGAAAPLWAEAQAEVLQRLGRQSGPMLEALARLRPPEAEPDAAGEPEARRAR
jgi:DNA-binding MarR family transcriptional regulator